MLSGHCCRMSSKVNDLKTSPKCAQVDLMDDGASVDEFAKLLLRHLVGNEACVSPAFPSSQRR